MEKLLSLDEQIENAPELDIDAAAMSWINSLDVAPASIASYSRSIRQFVSFIIECGQKKPRREDILEFKNYLIGINLKPTTVQMYIQTIKLFFKWTELKGIYPNIAQLIKGSKLDHGHKKDPLTSKQATNLVTGIDTSTLEGKRDYAIVALMLTSGLRTIEVQRAKIEDLRTVADFTALFVQGKGHQEKTDYVKVVDEVNDALRDYLDMRGQKHGILKAGDPLFASVSNRNPNGEMTTRSISRIAKKHLIESGVNSSRVTAHSLRHTAATLNLLSGSSIEETQQLLRHTNINTTMIYSHAIERAKNNSENRIAATIFKDDKKK